MGQGHISKWSVGSELFVSGIEKLFLISHGPELGLGVKSLTKKMMYHVAFNAYVQRQRGYHSSEDVEPLLLT